jgi:predicted transcriptional regulator
MPNAGLGELERRVMDELWSASEPLTVRQVHRMLATDRAVAYNTVLTVLRRLTDKGVVLRHREFRADRYAPVSALEQMVVALMMDALRQASQCSDRYSALAHFVERVTAEEAELLRRALRHRPQSTRAPRIGGCRGMRAVTAVPDPGRDRMVSRPPTSSARSVIDNNP